MVRLFVGIDLSWKCVPFKDRGTAVCVCDDKGRASMPELVTTDDDILSVVPSEGGAWIAIDASLRVPNLTGLRSPERMLVNEGIHVLPTNRRFLEMHCGGSRGESLAERLEKIGYERDGPSLGKERLFFETYPYAILRCITDERIRYKKGSAEVRSEGSAVVIKALQKWIPELEPPAKLMSMVGDEEEWTSEVPDMIDSLLCVGCLYAHWLYDGKMTRLVGDETDGYILLPRRDRA